MRKSFAPACNSLGRNVKKQNMINHVYPYFMCNIYTKYFFSKSLTPPYPLDLCRCSRSRRPPAPPELSPQFGCLARKTTRTPRSAGPAASLLPSALWEYLYTDDATWDKEKYLKSLRSSWSHIAGKIGITSKSSLTAKLCYGGSKKVYWNGNIWNYFFPIN